VLDFVVGQALRRVTRHCRGKLIPERIVGVSPIDDFTEQD
jgi:hypothetical protein